MFRWKRVLAGCAIAILAATSQARTPKTSPEQAIRALPQAQGEDLETCLGVIRETKDLLKRYGNALLAVLDKFPEDRDLAARVIGLLAERREEGCKFMARLVSPKYPAVVDEVLRRYLVLPRCEQLRSSVGNILKWAGDPEASAAAARLVDQVISLMTQTKERLIPEEACNLVLSGPEGRRKEALKMVVEAAPTWAQRCLVEAYNSEARNDGRLRFELLRAVATGPVAEAIPTLIAALDRKQDYGVACELLHKFGDAGLSGLMFAVRTSQSPSEGVASCLIAWGATAVASVIPLLEHPAPGIREFAVKYFQQVQHEDALNVLKEKYDKGGGRVGKVVLLDLLGRYPLDAIRPIVREALHDEDKAVRLMALRVVERQGGEEQGVLTVAEEDPDDEVRIRALDVAWHIGADGLASLAQRMVQYEKPAVAAKAAKVLGFVGGAEAVAVLQELLSARDEEVARAASEALWLLTFEDPAKGRVKVKSARQIKVPKPASVVSVDQARVQVFGKKGPLIVVLPGGPGMDFSWFDPILGDLADDFIVALVEPLEGDEVPLVRLIQPRAYRALLEALGRKKALVVSMGLGGTAGLWLSTLEPEAVAGVVAIVSPLPGAIEDIDNAITFRLREPFKSVAQYLVETQASFQPQPLNRYFARVMAPALTGKAQKPWELLGVAWDVLALGQTQAALSRPEVRFSAAEFPGPVTLLLPLSLLPEDSLAKFRKLANESQGTVTINDVSECGFLPVTECPSLVRKAILRCARAAGGEG